MSARLARLVRPALVAVCVCAEPVLHALGLPHPEGWSLVAINYLATQHDA